MAKKGHGGPRRSREAHRQWLYDKRDRQPAAVGGDASLGDACAAVSSAAGGEVPRRAPPGEEDLVAYYAAQGLFGAGAAALEQYEAFWAALRTPLPVTVTVDPLRDAASSCEARLSRDGWRRRGDFDAAGLSVWELEDSRYRAAPGIREWAERENRRGTLIFQEVVSLLPPVLLRLQPGQLCLDLCAAPGSKSVQLLRQLRGAHGQVEGAVLSVEVDAHRACIVLPRSLAKAASPASCTVLANAQHFPVLKDEGQPLTFSRVLVDVPCSGDGTLRKNSQAWRSWRRKEALMLFSKQRKILFHALSVMPPGAICVYSTCSMNPVEDEAVVLSVLRRWSSKERSNAVELLDTCAACKSACGLQPDEGLTTWAVPAPQRGGALFRSWAEVPEDIRDGRCTACWAIRPDMFPAVSGCDDWEVALTGQLRRCARFYPHRGNTGAFFVALFRKDDASIPTSLEVAPDSQRDGPLKGREHPLAQARWVQVQSEDMHWQQLSSFFGIDPAWSEARLRQGLLYWQYLGTGSEHPARLALVSPDVARILGAMAQSRRHLPVVRAGVFLFELLPRNFLTGKAATRWQLAAEGAEVVGSCASRRLVRLDVASSEHALRAPNRQVPLAELPADLLQKGVGLLEAPSSQQAHRLHICGGVLAYAASAIGEPAKLLPAVLTPQLLRLLVNNEDAAALAEALAPEQAKPAARAPTADRVHTIGGHGDLAESANENSVALRRHGNRRCCGSSCFEGLSKCWRGPSLCWRRGP